MMIVICYMLSVDAICDSLSVTRNLLLDIRKQFLNLVIICKNLFLSLVVVRLVIFFKPGPTIIAVTCSILKIRCSNF